MKFKRGLCMLLCCSMLASGMPVGASGESAEEVQNEAVAQSVAFTDVTVHDDFWSARQKQVVCTTIMAGISNVEASGGGISNFINTAKLLSGEEYGAHEGALYVDSDVHKLIEAMCYALQIDAEGDADVLAAQEQIRAKLEEWIPYYQGAQEEDGYFDTYFTLAYPDEKWTDFNKHELYCAGHFYETAVAHYRMTGGEDTRLFDMAIKNADYVESLFGPGKWKQVPGHQEIELALLKLANLCREIGTKDGVDYAAKAEKYVALAQFFLDTRGDQEGRHGTNLTPSMCQDDVPITEQTEALSHAVRAHYMYTAMADAMIQSGADTYNEVLLALWDSVNTKTYATGGVGVSDHHEGYGPDYYMPLDKAYCETCASVSNVMWNQRMNLLFGGSQYADKMEHVLYNAMLSGINLNGDRFFYTNEVTSAGRERVQWYGTACCPPNLMRTVLSLGGYIYVQKGDEIRMNLYIGNEADLTVSDGSLKLNVETDFPWDGNVKVTVSADSARNMSLRLRLPSWAAGANTVTVNGEAVSAAADADGYITLDRTWSDGDTVELYFPMEVQHIDMIEGVEYTENYTALRRGPIVYAAEQVDNEASPKLYYLEENASFTSTWVENLDGGEDPYGLRGVMTIKTEDAKVVSAGGELAASLTMVPYYATANRGAVPMEVYISTIPRTQALEFYATPSASFTFTTYTDRVEYLNDGNEAAASRWSSYTGPLNPWVEYQFTAPVMIRGCQVMWYDDGGGVQVPNGLTIQYWDGSDYVSVNPTAEYTEFPKNAYGTYTFDPVITQRIRLVIDNTVTGKAAGIVEWKLLGSLDPELSATYEPTAASVWNVDNLTPSDADLAPHTAATLTAVAQGEGTALKWVSTGWASMTWLDIGGDEAVTQWIMKEDGYLWAHVTNIGSTDIKLGLTIKDAVGGTYDLQGSVYDYSTVKYAIETDGLMQGGYLNNWGWITYVPAGFDGWVKVKLTGDNSLQSVMGDLDWSCISAIGLKSDNAGSFIIDDFRADIEVDNTVVSYTVIHKCGETVLGTETVSSVVTEGMQTITVTESALADNNYVNYIKTGASAEAGDQIPVGSEVIVSYEAYTPASVWNVDDLTPADKNLAEGVNKNKTLTVTAVADGDGTALQWYSDAWSGMFWHYMGGTAVRNWVVKEDGYLWAHIKNLGGSFSFGLTVRDGSGGTYDLLGTNYNYSTVKAAVENDGIMVQTTLGSWGWVTIPAGFEGWVKVKLVGENSLQSVMGDLDWSCVNDIGFKSDNAANFIIDDFRADIEADQRNVSYDVVHQCGDAVLEVERFLGVAALDAATVTIAEGALDAKPFPGYRKTGSEKAEGEEVSAGGTVTVHYEKTEVSESQGTLETVWDMDDASADYTYGSSATLNVVDYNGGKAYRWTSTDWANVIDISLSGTNAITDWTGATQLWMYVDASENPAANTLNLGLSVTDASGNALKPGQGEYYANVKAYYQADGGSMCEMKLAGWGWISGLPANFKGWVGVQLTGEYGYYTALVNNGKLSSFDFANIAAVGFKNELRATESAVIVDDISVAKTVEIDNSAPYFTLPPYRRMPTYMGNTITVNWGALDQEQNLLTYTIENQPANGTATVDGDGNVTFVPASLGESTMVLTVTDVYGASASFTLTTCVTDAIRVAAIGDSITQGIGADDPVTQSYPAQLQGLLDAENDGVYHVENFGIGGIKLMSGTGFSWETMASKYTSLAYKPDIAVIMLGSNDTWSETDEKLAADFESELRSLIGELVAANPDVQVLLCTTPYRYASTTGSIEANARTEQYILPAQRKIAEELDYVTLVDINALMTQEILGDSTYMDDDTHPNAAGYTLLAQEICGAVQKLAEKTEITQWNLTLGEDIGANFYVKLADAANTQVKMTVAGKTTEVKASDVTPDADGYYVFSADVAAAQMTDTITVELVVNGETVDSGSYTVRQYADVILAGDYDDVTKNLVKAMLNYGSKAQTYFGYNTDAPAGDGITVTETDIPADVEAMSVSGKADGVSYYGATLVFQSKTAVRFYFTGDITDCVFEADGESLTPVQKDGKWYVEIADINPQDLDKAITLSVNGTLTVTYSPLNYMVRMYNGNGSDTLKALLKALYTYHLAAVEYTK